jgi:hypothetical protein
MQAYSDPSRESEPHALPDVEVFYARQGELEFYNDADAESESASPAGWYWWHCFPGCLPDSDPYGPFETQADAVADSQADIEDGEAR